MPEEAHSKQRPPRHWWRWVVGIIVVLLLGIGGYGYYLYASVHNSVQKTYTPLKKKSAATSAKLKATKPLSLLLLGTDTGDLGRTEARGRTDTIILLTINPKTKTTRMTSIPRDTMTQMIGQSQLDVEKLNTAYAIGGADMCVNTVARLVNVPINYYAVVNMGGLTKVVDDLGGVDVTPTLSFSYSGYTFTKGKKVHMSGATALAYSRMRYDDPQGDYGRQARQRQIIMSVLKSATSLNSLTHFKALLKSVESNLRTNLSFNEMVSLFSNYRGAIGTVKQDHIQGVEAIINEASFQVVSTKELQRASDEMRASLDLPHAALDNFETQQNALNPSFDWELGSGQYMVQ
ncbi:LCP family protein [Lacticaseibacillus baoqingensis]|uniref:LCP family protein n=1 Tax=Lacticaseibacillus baoqingensis TaxID=2486013 RepID=A0ABW4E7I5_9LACO|nr:LCP family protein [Lacticaseibacillus baoqingensis]